MDKLKEMLGEELYNQVIEKTKDSDIVFMDKKAGEWIPKAKYMADNKELKDQIATLQTEIETRTSDLEKVQEKIKAGEDAATQIQALQEKNKETEKTLNSEMLRVRKEAAALVALSNQGALHPEILIKSELINFDIVNENQGKWLGLDDQIKGLKDGEYKDQFKIEHLEGDPPPDGIIKDKPKELTRLQNEYTEAQKVGDTKKMTSLNRKMHELRKE